MAGRILGDQQIRILVAEDDNFQRLALIDILELCNYEVVAVENGRQAHDELLNAESAYDLVLLDLMMPEMDGLEVLTFMMQNDRLKDIPVIIMSSDAEMESVSTCLNTGAKDYLIKPIRIQNVKGLAAHVNMNAGKNKNEEGTASLAIYQNIRLIGKGAAGSVNLVRNTTNGEYYALKTIELKLMSASERKLAENEVTLLRVLNGPTIIHYYEHFTENDTIYIVMEYAEGGGLSERISEYKDQNKFFPNEQILDWIAQLVIGILLMHSKNILHRDIKTHNMFLTKDNIIKLGDFGISKALGTTSDFAKTYCGTPYFMSPEVCLNDSYNQKSDIWALGCAIYELATLRKPFDSNSIPGLIKMICEKEFEPVPDRVDLKIKMLIYSMLQKDPTKRPSIWEIAERDIVKERIMKFITEHNCKDSVSTIIDFHKDRKQGGIKTNGGTTLEVIPEETVSTLTPFMNRLEDLADMISNNIERKTIPVSFLTKHENVFTGEDLNEWFKKELNVTNYDEIAKVVVAMMEQEIIHSPNGVKDFQSNAKALYRFQVDKPNSAANMLKVYKESPRNPSQLTTDLVNKMNELLKEVRVEVTPGEVGLNIKKLKASYVYKEFKKAICELQAAPLSSLNKSEKIAYFLNIYQIMHVHKVIKESTEKHEPASLVDRIKGLVVPEKPSFYYNLCHMDFTIDEVVHGILRGNKKAPTSYYFRSFGEKDPRNRILEFKDPRGLFVLYPENYIPSAIELYTGQQYEEKLDKVCKKYLASTVIYDPTENELQLPELIKTYKEDFGSNSDLIEFVLKYNKFTNNPAEVRELLREGKLNITYDD